jgi:hypothetical protein
VERYSPSDLTRAELTPGIAADAGVRDKLARYDARVLPVSFETYGRPAAATIRLLEDVVVLGASGRPAVAAAAVAATAVEWLLTGRNRVRGMVGLAEMVEPLAFLDELAGRGLEAEVFEGDRALA